MKFDVDDKNRCRLVCVKFHLNRCRFAVAVAKCLGGSLFWDTYRIRIGVYVHHCHMLRRNSKETVRTPFTIVYTRWSIYTSYCRKKFRSFFSSSSLRHRVRIRFQDFALRLPGLSRSWKFYKHNSRTYFQDFPRPNSFSRSWKFLKTQFEDLNFQDFPSPGNFIDTIRGLSRWRGNRV